MILPNVPGAMFIQGGTFIPDSRVSTRYIMLEQTQSNPYKIERFSPKFRFQDAPSVVTAHLTLLKNLLPGDKNVIKDRDLMLCILVSFLEKKLQYITHPSDVSMKVIFFCKYFRENNQPN